MFRLNNGAAPKGPATTDFVRRSIAGVFAVLGIILFMGLGTGPAAAADELAARNTDLVLTGDAKCTRCHDETDEKPVLAIGKTKHGTRADGRTPSCATCHGESETHRTTRLKRGNGQMWAGGERTRAKPDITYSKGTPTPASERSAVCLGCHKGGQRMFWSSGSHANNDVACSTCHQVHAAHDKVRDKKTQTEVCFGCHKKQRVQFRKVSRHPILEGKVTCSSCHNPHGSAGAKNLARDTVNDTCFQCHAEKRGPYIWGHQPVTENCAYCHDPHGTNMANLLKWRPPFLCQQCHEPDSHRGTLPDITAGAGATQARVILARGCLNCHTLIHGSNNPANTTRARALFR